MKRSENTLIGKKKISPTDISIFFQFLILTFIKIRLFIFKRILIKHCIDRVFLRIISVRHLVVQV